MGFWIRSYRIELEKLPLSLMTWSSLVVVLCGGILSSILLLLPIQDKIKGEVNIYPEGQPRPMNAPSAGFLYFHKNEEQYIKKGDLLFTIDVEISEEELANLDEFIYTDLDETDLQETADLISNIKSITKGDFRQVNNELHNLADQIRQLDILKDAYNPRDLLQDLDRSISLKVKQLNKFQALNQSEEEVLNHLKEQLSRDSASLEGGAISERDLQETRRKYLDKKSVLIENDLRKQALSGDIIDEQKEKNQLLQSFSTDIEKLILEILGQKRIIREKYQEYLEEHVVTSPINGYATWSNNIVSEETVREGQRIMLLSKAQNTTIAHSEMYVSAENAGKIKSGMKVRIGLSEFDQKEFGIYYTTVKQISDMPQDDQYKVILDCVLPLTTSYNIPLPSRSAYSGNGEILLGKINLLTKISQEIYFNREKYASR